MLQSQKRCAKAHNSVSTSLHLYKNRVASKLNLRPSNLQLMPCNFQLQYNYLLIFFSFFVTEGCSMRKPKMWNEKGFTNNPRPIMWDSKGFT